MITTAPSLSNTTPTQLAHPLFLTPPNQLSTTTNVPLKSLVPQLSTLLARQPAGLWTPTRNQVALAHHLLIFTRPQNAGLTQMADTLKVLSPLQPSIPIITQSPAKEVTRNLKLLLSVNTPESDKTEQMPLLWLHFSLALQLWLLFIDFPIIDKISNYFKK